MTTICFWLSPILLLIPLWASIHYKLGQSKAIVVGAVRMAAQLIFVAAYLGFLFETNNPLLTLLWVSVMLLAATWTTIHTCKMRVKYLATPLMLALIVGTFVPISYILLGVLGEIPFANARETIPLVGMVLGNCLRANVVGLNQFYKGLVRDQRRYFYALAQGATPREAYRPYMAQALKESILPMIASLATTGLVTLPGMMTGAIIGGASPWIAVRYQWLILLAVTCAIPITVLIVLHLSASRAFDSTHHLRKDLFKTA